MGVSESVEKQNTIYKIWGIDLELSSYNIEL